MLQIVDSVTQHSHPTVDAGTRSVMYGFLATLFRDQPTTELIDQFRDQAFREALSEAGVNLPDDFFAGSDKQYLTKLQVEYARLFIGPGGHISPHESVHRKDEESRLYGQATVNVMEFLETAGFDFKTDYKGLPDHISVELEFMQTLTGWEAEALEEGNTKLATQCLDIEKYFFQQHLAHWIPGFCTKVAEDAELPFYREIAKLTSDFIVMEEEYLTAAKHHVPTEGINKQPSIRSIQ
jgi:putative dimethyl sulfoxide reductase chaperone